MDPATNFIHYGQAIFEGLKAYRQPDGSIATFRPEANAAPLRPQSPRGWRCRRCPRSCSSSRCDALVRAGRRRGCPTTRRSRSTCGRSCSPPRSASACARRTSTSTCSSRRPAGAYFPRGVKPVSVWLSTEYVRAAPGGTGEAKCARQLRRLAGRAGAGRGAGLRPGRVARRASSAAGSRRWAA